MHLKSNQPTHPDEFWKEGTPPASEHPQRTMPEVRITIRLQ